MQHLLFWQESPHPQNEIIDRMRFKNSDDKALMQEIVSGSAGAFDELVLRYSHKLYQFVWYLVLNRDLAEDIVQEVFTKLWAYPNKYNPEKSNRFSAWIFTVAKHKAFDEMQKLKRITGAEEPETLLSEVPDSEEIFYEKHKQEQLTVALKKLDPENLAVTELYYFENRSYREIAEILNLTERRVEYKLSRAKKELKENLSIFMNK